VRPGPLKSAACTAEGTARSVRWSAVHYAIEYVNGRPHTIFPIGVSLLAAPFVGLIVLINPSFNTTLREQVPDTLKRF
jgi:hypothetical protein